MRRGGPLRSRSSKGARRARAEVAVKAAVMRRDGGCVLRAWQLEELDTDSGAATVPRCRGRLDKHETIPRSLWRDGALDPANCVILCRRHHDWIEESPATRAWARGRGLLRGSADR